MIILDTNVLSEVMRGPAADPRVLRWLRSVQEQPVTTVINQAEILAGLSLLSAGAKRDRLVEAAKRAFSTVGVVLPLVPESASSYAEIVVLRRRGGRPIGSMDALIAAIAQHSWNVDRDPGSFRIRGTRTEADRSVATVTG